MDWNKIKNFFRYYLIERQSKWNLLIVIVPFTLLVIWGYIRKNKVNVEAGQYTIGYIYRIYWPIVNAKTIMYSYKINTNEYTNTDEYDSRKEPEVNKRYLVQFSLVDNGASRIFQDIPVPDSIKEAPPKGWKELPEWAKKNK